MDREEQIFAEIFAKLTATLLAQADGKNQQASQAALQQIKTWEEHAFPMLLTALCFEFADESKTTTREHAGIMIRGLLVAKEEERKIIVAQRWAAVPPKAKEEIKNKLLATMQAAETSYRHKAAEAVAQIAILDLPQDHWKGVIAMLSSAVTAEENSDLLKEASLIALKEICIGSEMHYLTPFSFDILFAIITGMQSPHKELQLVSCQALASAIEFSEQNFSDAELRGSIMSRVLAMTVSEDEEIRTAIYECLVNIAMAYYDFLPQHMNEGLYSASLTAIKSDPCDAVVKQAIEFWSTICEEETDRIRENQSAAETSADKLQFHNFIEGAIDELTEPLFQALSRGEVDPELETWTVASAASTCIALIATTLGDGVVGRFIPFISGGINSENERTREAAVLCFGSIMDGPGLDAIGPIIFEALPVLFTRLEDPSHIVKHTTAWCLARIGQFHPAAIGTHLEAFIVSLCRSLEDAPSIAAVCADAIDFLAGHINEEGRENSPLNNYLDQLFTSLTTAADREDADEHSLRLSAFAAVRSLVKATPESNIDMIVTVLNMFAPRLRSSIGSAADVELQGEFVGILAACTRRLGPNVETFADGLMAVYNDLLASRPGVSSIYQEVFMAVGALADSISNFDLYIGNFFQSLEDGLNHYIDPDLCNMAIQLTSALCFSLHEKFVPYCDNIMRIFQDHLDAPDLPPSLAPTIVNAFSDIAYVMESEFVRYLGPIMDILHKYSDYARPNTERMIAWEDIEPVQQWRSSLMVVYSLTLQTCGEQNRNALQPYLPSMFHILNFVNDDKRRDDTVNRYACGLIYDIIACFPQKANELKRYELFLNYCLNSSSSEPRTIDAAQTALDKLSQY